MVPNKTERTSTRKSQLLWMTKKWHWSTTSSKKPKIGLIASSTLKSAY